MTLPLKWGRSRRREEAGSPHLNHNRNRNLNLNPPIRCTVPMLVEKVLAGQATARTTVLTGARQISSRVPACRINAAFRLALERRIYAAAKNFAVRAALTLLLFSFLFALCARADNAVTNCTHQALSAALAQSARRQSAHLP